MNNLDFLPKGVNIHHRLDFIDRNYCKMTTSIGVQYVFESKIDTELLKKSLTELLKEIPALAGRADFTAMEVSQQNNGMPFVVVNNHPGTASDYGQVGKTQRNRTDFVIEPKREKIYKCAAALMCVKISNFVAGGCILGVTVSHALMDAFGFHIVVARWSKIFNELKKNGRYVPNNNHSKLISGRSLLSFGTDRDKKKLFKDREKAGIPKPINFNGIRGKLSKYFLLKALDRVKRTDRELTYFSKEQTGRLKQVVAKESGGPWVTTQEALSAHLAKVMSELRFGEKYITKMQLINLVNIRGRVNLENEEKHALFAGNAMFVYSTIADFSN